MTASALPVKTALRTRRLRLVANVQGLARKPQRDTALFRKAPSVFHKVERSAAGGNATTLVRPPPPEQIFEARGMNDHQRLCHPVRSTRRCPVVSQTPVCLSIWTARSSTPGSCRGANAAAIAAESGTVTPILICRARFRSLPLGQSRSPESDPEFEVHPRRGCGWLTGSPRAAAHRDGVPGLAWAAARPASRLSAADSGDH